MKKLLLTLALVLAANQSIQPMWQSIKSVMTVGNVLGYTVLPTLGTYVAYVEANKEANKRLDSVENELKNTQDSLNQVANHLVELPQQLIPKETHFYDNWGTPGAVLGGLLTGYSILKWGLSEFSQAMSIVGLINSLKQRQPEQDMREQNIDEHSRQHKNNRLRQIPEAQRRA